MNTKPRIALITPALANANNGNWVDMAGKSVLKEGKNLQKGLNSISIPTNSWTTGTYIFNVSSKDGLLNYSQKVVILK